MSLLQAVVLGVVQGLTEFLPVSSSAHLVLVPWWLGWTFQPEAAFAFDVLVQLGTLVGVIVFFARDIVELIGAAAAGLWRRRPLETPLARRAWYLALATVPAVVAGLALKDQVEAAFSNPLATSGFLLVTAAALALAERAANASRNLESMGWGDAWWIGIAQAVALFPGISRSGATMAAGRARGFLRAEAARFSFLMSIPVMLGAGLVAGRDLIGLSAAREFALPLAAGFAAAAVVGYLSIRWMLSFVARRPLTVFSIYCLVVGSVGLATALLRAGQ
jgi:undecaprenyl-diphosphatase